MPLQSIPFGAAELGIDLAEFPLDLRIGSHGGEFWLPSLVMVRNSQADAMHEALEKAELSLSRKAGKLAFDLAWVCYCHTRAMFRCFRVGGLLRGFVLLVRAKPGSPALPLRKRRVEWPGMSNVTTIEAVVEHGQIRLPVEVRLPERAKVYVVIPDVGPSPGLIR